MAKFEIVSRFKTAELSLPERKTSGSAGYDLAAAEDIVIPPLNDIESKILWTWANTTELPACEGITLEQMERLTKKVNARPTLVSTGLKCYLDPGTYLELSVRSSTPLKYWLVLANGIGIIDADYADNSSNEGEIFLQFINLSPIPIKIQKGDIIGQGIIKSYLTVEGDAAAGQRTGGFGSTSAE